MDEKHREQYRALGITISYYRKLNGMSQKELADAVHISRTHMSNIEAPNGKTSVSLDKLFDIAEVLNVSVAAFFRPL